MLDRKRNLNKLKKARKLANAKKARRTATSKKTAQKDSPTAQRLAATRPNRAPQSHLTDTEALTRKVREAMVRDAQAAFAAVMAELNASQVSTAPYKTEESEEEADEEIDFEAEWLKV